VVLSIDEKSQIQAFDRTQPGLPIKLGKCGTMTHDYNRHGTTTLFAALNTLDGVVHGHCMQRRTHQEFVRFLNTVERAVPASKLVHAILDNYATHKHPKSLPSRKRGSKPGSPATRAGSFTSPQPPGPGSMRLKASSPKCEMAGLEKVSVQSDLNWLTPSIIELYHNKLNEKNVGDRSNQPNSPPSAVLTAWKQSYCRRAALERKRSRGRPPTHATITANA
jgi:hypothetical protein